MTGLFYSRILQIPGDQSIQVLRYTNTLPLRPGLHLFPLVVRQIKLRWVTGNGVVKRIGLRFLRFNHPLPSCKDLFSLLVAGPVLVLAIATIRLHGRRSNRHTTSD